jgi:hypothetical protein
LETLTGHIRLRDLAAQGYSICHWSSVICHLPFVRAASGMRLGEKRFDWTDLGTHRFQRAGPGVRQIDWNRMSRSLLACGGG